MNGGKIEAVTSRRLKRVWQFTWIACFAFIAWLSLLMLPASPITPELDLSWTGALPYFAHRGFHFGTDIIFTYGPLGHFAGYAYTGYLATERTLWEFVIKGLAAVLFCWALCELGLVIRVILGACLILFLGNYEESYSFTIILAGLLLLRSAERRFWIHALLGLFLAVLALVKFTYFVQATCAIGSVVAYYASRRRWIALTSLTASFVTGLLVCWELAGQNMGDFPPYITNSLAITAGYNAAMFMPTPNTAALWVAVFVSGLMILQLALFGFYARDKARLVFGSIFLILMLFFLWKHAFTRWHNHALKFFFLFPELMLASWLLSNTGRPNRWALALMCVAVAAALLGMTILERGRVSNVLALSRDQLRFAWGVVTGYGQFEKERGARLVEARRKFSLPRIQAAVAGRTVDVLGYRQAIAILNGLNYVPRPIFQSYSAYAPSLIQLNKEHYQSAKRPEFVISKLETIDNRFPTLEDSGVLVELLYHYRPILSENGWHLWEAAHPVEDFRPQLISTIRTKLGQYVSIPANAFIWVELDLKETRWGRMAAFLNKSAPILIELEDDAGLSFRYRIVPAIARGGWLLNPELTNDDQLVLAANGAPLPRYKWLRLAAEAGGDKFFKQTVEIKFSSLPDVVHSPEDASSQR